MAPKTGYIVLLLENSRSKLIFFGVVANQGYLSINFVNMYIKLYVYLLFGLINVLNTESE